MTLVPASIAADGSLDVGAELTAWLAANATGTVTFQAGGVYRINDAPVVVENAADLVLDFNGATLQRTSILAAEWRYPNRGGYLRLTGRASNTVVRNLATSGPNANDGSLYPLADRYDADRDRYYVVDARGDEWPLNADNHSQPLGAWGEYCVALEFEHGIDVVSANGLTIEDCTLVGMFGDGVYLGSRCDDVTLTNVSVDRNGRQGFAAVHGSNITMKGCSALHSRRAGLDLEPNTSAQTITDVVVDGCTFRSRLLGITAGGQGVVSDVSVSDCTFLKNGVPVISSVGNGGRRRNWRIVGNVIDAAGSPAAVIRLRDTDRVAIRRNSCSVPVARSMSFVGLLTCSDVYVEGNRIDGAAIVVADEANNGLSSWVDVNNTTTDEKPRPSDVGGILRRGNARGERGYVNGHQWRWDGERWRYAGRNPLGDLI